MNTEKKNIKELGKTAAKYVCGSAIVLSCVGTYVQASKLSSMVDSLGAMMYSIYFNTDTNTVGNTSTETSQALPSLYSNEYFKSNSIDVTTNEEIFSLADGEYFVYFYQTGCGYCTMTAPYIEKYINEGKTSETPIFFVNVGSASYNWLWINGDVTGSTTDDFGVTGTPTILKVNADKTATSEVGPYDIASMLGYTYED